MSRATKRRKLSSSEDNQRSKSTRTKTATATNNNKTHDESVDETRKPESQSAKVELRYDEELPSIKGLASSDSTIRRKAFVTIIDHLNKRDAYSVVSSTQWLQLWRGFHVCVYMHDSKNMVSVQNLIKDIAQIFEPLSDKDIIIRGSDHREAIGWVRDCHSAFWETIVREWAGIDSHRMNKYLLLVRFVVREIFKTVFRGSSDLNQDELSRRKEQLQRDVITPMLEKGPLKPTARMGSGLILHLLDVWNSELQVVISESVGDKVHSQKDEDEKENTESAVSKNDRDLLVLLRKPLNDIARSDSGAPKPVRLRAKETITELEDTFGLGKQ